MSDRIAGPPPRASQPKLTSPVPPARSSSVPPRPRIERGRRRRRFQTPMDAERHQVVHQVVARRDAVEHRAHQRGFSACRNRGGSRNRRSAVGVGRSCAASDIACCRPMPELPEVETVMRGLRGAAGGRRDPRAPRSTAPTCAGRSRPIWRAAADRRAGRRLPPARQIHPDAARRRRSACCCISACPGASCSAPGRRTADAAARASGAGDRRRLAGRLRRSAPLRLARSGADRGGGRAPPARRAGAGAAGRRASRRRRCRRRWPARRTPIKAALLDQRVVAGLGNIYVCEALFRAGICAAAARRTACPAPAPPGWCRRSARRSTRRSRPAAPRLRDYVQPDGRARLFPARLAGLWPRGRAPARAAPGRPPAAGIAPHRAVRRAARSIARAPSAS